MKDAASPLIVGGLGPGAYSPMTLLLHCSSIEGVRWLRFAILTIATGVDPGDLAQSPVVAVEGASSLRLVRVLESPRNHIRIHDGAGLDWTASANEWVTITDLLDPFLEGTTGHQYLATEALTTYSSRCRMVSPTRASCSRRRQVPLAADFIHRP
jgi:hypothetical protein